MLANYVLHHAHDPVNLVGSDHLPQIVTKTCPEATQFCESCFRSLLGHSFLCLITSGIGLQLEPKNTFGKCCIVNTVRCSWQPFCTRKYYVVVIFYCALSTSQQDTTNVSILDLFPKTFSLGSSQAP